MKTLFDSSDEIEMFKGHDIRAHERFNRLGKSTLEPLILGLLKPYEKIGYMQDFKRAGYVKGRHCIF